MLLDKINKYKSSRLLKGMFTLALGGIGAKIIAFIALPIITRIYSSAEFGELSIFSAITLVVAPLFSLRYVNAISVPRSDIVALNLLALSLVFIFVLGTFFGVGLAIFGGAIDSVFSFSVSKYWWLIVLTAIGAGLYEALTLWATRRREYRVIASTQFQQSIFGSITKVVLGYLGLSTLGLLLGHWIQNSAGLISYFKKLGPDLVSGVKSVNIGRMATCAKKYSDFPTFRLPSHVFMLASLHAPVLFFGYYYSTEVTGQLALSIMVLSLPTQVIGNAMSNAFLGEISRKGSFNDAALSKQTMSVVKTMLALSAAPAVVLIVFGREMFSIVFGQEWEMAGMFSQILSFYLVAKFVSTPLMHVFTVLKKQEMFFQLNLVRFIVLVGVGVSAVMLSIDPVVTLIMFSAAMTLHYSYTIFRVFRLLNS